MTPDWTISWAFATIDDRGSTGLVIVTGTDETGGSGTTDTIVPEEVSATDPVAISGDSGTTTEGTIPGMGQTHVFCDVVIGLSAGNEIAVTSVPLD